MSDKAREAMERERARLLAQVAEAFDRDMAEAQRLHAKYPDLIVLAPAARANSEPQVREEQGSLVRLGDLAERYQTHPNSPYQKVKHQTRINYVRVINRLLKDCGDGNLADWKQRNIQEFYDRWAEGGKVAMGHQLITMLRGLINFGYAVLEDAQCERLAMILHNMNFPMSERRTERLTADHAAAIRAKAHEMGWPSVALAQAFQFDCKLRPGEVIGQWVPLSEPGASDVLDNNLKWVNGLRWSEIDRNLILRRTTKHHKDFDLKVARMVLEELERVPAEKKTGPIIVNERTRLPYLTNTFRSKWRSIAKAAGVPTSLRNMDSRPDPEGQPAWNPNREGHRL